jgi:peptidoglycan/xylan/chitin deacetylase (PgdA/CDA1 family)
MEKGRFVISLDFELLWGVFDKVNHKDKVTYFNNTRAIIPEILRLLEQYKVSCTWATVGMLFNNNWENWKENFPAVLPEYENKSLSAYEYGETIIGRETEALCFAPDIIKSILEVPGQEIATHTYSHYYCLEDGQTKRSFKADLEKSIAMAAKKGIELKSLVFPRNQFNEEYLKICYKLGIKNVRSNPNNWYWKNTQTDSISQKIFRTGDAYLGLNNKSYKLSSFQPLEGLPLAQKASRLLRPYSANKVFNRLKLQRIFAEMTSAAKNNEIYHLWWHPHNFGNNPSENIQDLIHILEHYKSCRNKYGFASMNMEEIGLSLEK